MKQETDIVIRAENARLREENVALARQRDELLAACQATEVANGKLDKAHAADVPPGQKRRLVAAALTDQVIAGEMRRAAIAATAEGEVGDV